MSHAIKDLASFFDARFVEHVGVRYPFNNGKDAKIIKDLREIYSDEQLQVFMTAFFALEDDFVKQSGYGLGVFRGCLPKVIASVQKQKQPDEAGHYPKCATKHDCVVRQARELREREQGPSGLRLAK